MSRINRLSSEERDNLVAYLDGELDESASKSIEQMLSISPVARHDVEMLSRTWDLIGLLPRATVSAEFTQQTMTLARQKEAGPAPLEEQAWYPYVRRTAFLAGWTAALGLAAWVGFAVTHDWLPNDSRLLLDDLPVVENLDVYSEVESIDFLKELRRSGTFSEPIE